MVSNQEIRNDISQIQAELQEALENLKEQFSKKLNDGERQEIQNEFKEINELLERIKTGLVWVVLFGKTSVGKSAIINSLMNMDVAKVGVEHDKTTIATPYKKEPWYLVDVPGIMGQEENEKLGIEEAKKAHGHIFVINSEPYQDEIELFNLIHEHSPNIPKIVFVNQWDKVTKNQPKNEQKIICSRISEKMSKFVKSPEDIVYGSAMLFDPERDQMLRQELPQLLERLYESAGTLGELMNVLDPTQRAGELNHKINNRIFEIRLKVARKVISAFGTAAIVGIVVPASTVTVYPALLIGMVFTICKIMGKQITKKRAGEIMWTCLKILGVNSVGGIAALILTDAATTALTPVGGLGLALGGLASIGGMGWYCYSQTVKLGEITLEYIRNDFSWGEQGQKEVLDKCQKKVEEIYVKLKPI
ncbi:50S ribosome-binding GTPase [Phormidium sp. LEGE 05292]|uniref:GTPase domain-containing protein n=1 Tax=[Phormidium] sp. LEGE 05292 TaxID=767427 RepID=UPI001882320E|nr:GTPase [Phormidium sp. LEGE 05292]MBE9224869.1 50S ribosome-binding GTPase [Phormidium sp. LEGE 05292]